MGDKDTPQAPQLPKNVPEDIRLFFECKRLTVTVKDGVLGWITLPEELKAAAKEGSKPKLTITPGATPGSATIKVSLTTKVGIDVSFELPATIKDGQLNVDTSESYLPQGFKDGITQSVKELNDWFKANGYGFGPPAFGQGQVALSKVELASAPGQTTTIPTPVPTPTPGPDIPKPTPPPPPVVPPEPQAAGTDWSHLTPTRDQWDKALQEARTEGVPPKPPGVQPPGPKPVVGAGGPGGPKAPVGLGGVAWNYVLLGIVVALLAAAGIFLVGPALGLFGGSVGITAMCQQPGDVVVGLTIDVTPVGSSALLDQLGLSTAPTSTVSWTTAVRCAAGSAASPTPAPTLTGGCVSVVHRPLGTYPSYLRWVLRFGGDVPSTATLTISYREEGGGILQFDDIPIVRGVATPDTGITRIGAKTIVGVTVHIGSNAFDLTKSAASVFGSFTVTSERGVLAGNACQ